MTAIAPEHRVVLIRIPRTAPAGGEPEALYRATREWWKVAAVRTVVGSQAPTHALVVVKGSVVAAYAIDGWEQHPASGKRRFTGIPADGAVARYVGADVAGCFAPGSQNPLRHLHCEGSAPADLTIDRPVERRPELEMAPGYAVTKYTQPWVQVDDAEHQRRSALSVAALATARDTHPVMRRILLKDLFWYLTEWSGKHGTRFRSLEAMTLQATLPVGTWRKLVAHEHVVTKKSLSLALLAAADDDDARWEVMRRAVACVVTREEHKLLTPFDKTHSGWARYVAAGISVVDMATGQVLTPRDIAATLVDED